MKRVLAILLALTLALALCACGKKEPPAAPAAPAAPAVDPMVGYYKMTRQVSDGEEADLAEMEKYGLTYYLVVNADGTAYLDMLGEQEPLKWNDKQFTGAEDGESIDYTFAGGKVTMSDGETEMEFSPLTAEELAYYKEHGSGGLEDLLNGGETFDTIGVIDGCTLEFVGAEEIKDDDGKPALRVWFDFTNDTDKVKSAFFSLSFGAEQDGREVDWTYLMEDVPEADNVSRAVAPGHTIRGTQVFAYDPAGGAVTVKASAFFGDSVAYKVDPKALPGAPGDTFAMQEEPGVPAWLAGMPQTWDGVEILGVEMGKDWDDKDVLILRYRFTNTAQEATSFFTAYNLYVLQDGYELDKGYADAEGTANSMEEVAPGESVDCADVFKLRTKSPVAAVFQAFPGSEQFGRSFELP